MNTYNYTKTPLAVDSLEKSVRDSAIITSLNHISALGSSVDIVFNAALSVGDVAILGAIVAAHNGVPLPQNTTQQVVLSSPTTSAGFPKIALYEPEGSSATIISHDFTRKTTWYQGSIRLLNQTLSTTDNLSFNMVGKTNWIDLRSGNLYDEDNVLLQTNNLYVPKIYIDGVLQTSGYTVDSVTGTVTFSSTVTGVVTASFHYADKSWYIIKPAAGKTITIKAAEVQFSTNVTLSSPFIFEVWVFHPGLQAMVPYPGTQIVYKNPKDFISACNLGQGLIPKWGGLEFDVHVFPFDYARPKPIRSSDTAEVRVYVKDHSQVTGEFATATFYVAIDSQ